MNPRYMNNSEIVRKIAKNFGYKLYGFDPSWSLIKTITEQSIDSKENEIISRSLSHSPLLQVSDEFMGRLAIFMGYNWEFEDTIEKIESTIKSIELHEKSFIEGIEQSQKTINAIQDKLNINIDSKFIIDDDSIAHYNSSIIELKEEIKLRKRLKEMKL